VALPACSVASPEAGATMGTGRDTFEAGGRTALSGLDPGAVVLMVVIPRLGASGLASSIPMAVDLGRHRPQGGGSTVIDWGFLKRAHHLSMKGALIHVGVFCSRSWWI